MRKRLMKVMMMLAALAAAGIIYFIFAEHGHSLPCVFYEITGFYCPGCGSTRLARRLMKFDAVGAFRGNPAVFIAFPFILAVLIRRLYCYIRYGEATNEKWMTVVCTILAVILIAFGVLRNIPGLEFLTPQ